MKIEREILPGGNLHRIKVDGVPGPAALYEAPAFFETVQGETYISLTDYYGEAIYAAKKLSYELPPWIDNSDKKRDKDV